jgi:hypothetical protein
LFEHDDVHGSGSILPWHRYAIAMFEDALVEECGLKGGMPCKLFIPKRTHLLNQSII